MLVPYEKINRDEIQTIKNLKYLIDLNNLFEKMYRNGDHYAWTLIEKSSENESNLGARQKRSFSVYTTYLIYKNLREKFPDKKLNVLKIHNDNLKFRNENVAIGYEARVLAEEISGRIEDFIF
jgi:hypothetical protein